MKKETGKAMKAQTNKDKSIEARLKVGCNLSTFTRDTITDKVNYKLKLTNLKEQAVFSNLCDITKPYWNSVEYPSVKALLKPLGVTNEYRLKHILEHFKELDLIKELKEDGYRRIYVNPKYFYKTSKLKVFVLKLFDCNYVEMDNKHKKNTKQTASIEKEKKGNIMNVGF
jgi:hypothetical protein